MAGPHFTPPGAWLLPASSYIKRALDREGSAFEHMGVDHRRFDILVAKQILDSSNIRTILQQMCGEGVAQRVAGGALLDVGEFDRPLQRFLYAAGIDVVAPGDPTARIGRELRRGEDVLPDPLARRFGVFSGEGDREVILSEVDPVRLRCKRHVDPVIYDEHRAGLAA